MHAYSTPIMLAFAIAAMTFLLNAHAAGETVENAATRASSTATEAPWRLRIPQSNRLTFRGVVDWDGAGLGTGGMMYPGGDPISFLAGILTHGVVVDKIKQEQKERLQESADKVWTPYLSSLDDFGYRDLMDRALAKTVTPSNFTIASATNHAAQEKSIDSTPVVYMTQDQLAIVLDNLIVIHSRPNGPNPGSPIVIRVLSDPGEITDPLGFWTGNNGENLKNVTAQLVALSLDIVLLDMSSSANWSDTPYKTVRYRHGSTEKMERAQVLAVDCNRLLLRTLRGALMSVPSARPAASNSSSDNCRNRAG